MIYLLREVIIMRTTTKRTERIDLRLYPKAKEVIQTAAALRHKTVSDFILESALSIADQDLADRQHFELDGQQWEAFQIALDAPVRSLPRLNKLFEEQGFFD